MCEDEIGDVVPLTPELGISTPIIQGPFFEKHDEHLSENENEVGDVENL